MYTQPIRHILTTVFVIPLLTFANSARAQGVANGLVTSHDINTGTAVIEIGDVTNPIPIDLDPNGPPWTKWITNSLNDWQNYIAVNFHETIVNVGAEPWYDWHEHILPEPSGQFVALWHNDPNSFLMYVNGNPITYNVVGLGTPDLTVNNFSQPVYPGDILEIRKSVMHGSVLPAGGPLGGPIFIIEEYPTPEPTSAALIGLGSLALAARRRNPID